MCEIMEYVNSNDCIMCETCINEDNNQNTIHNENN
jgi:hypothetical protein